MAVTVPPVAMKVAVVELAAIVTDAGTVSAGLLQEMATEAPLPEAATERATVQTDVAPEEMVAG